MPNASDKAKLNMLEGVVNSYLEVSIADLEKQLKELGWKQELSLKYLFLLLVYFGKYLFGQSILVGSCDEIFNTKFQDEFKGGAR